jgi:ketosteroid isomerase-like protein
MTRAFLAAFAARDWDAFAGLLAPDLVVIDHRVLGWEPLRGPAAYVDALRSLAELAPDVRLRLDHVIETSEHGIIYAPTWIGSREGGAFDAPSIIVAEVDAQHRIRRFDQYDVDRVDEARARFEAIRPGAGQPLHGEVPQV